VSRRAAHERRPRWVVIFDAVVNLRSWTRAGRTHERKAKRGESGYREFAAVTVQKHIGSARSSKGERLARRGRTTQQSFSRKRWTSQPAAPSGVHFQKIRGSIPAGKLMIVGATGTASAAGRLDVHGIYCERGHRQQRLLVVNRSHPANGPELPAGLSLKRKWKSSANESSPSVVVIEKKAGRERARINKNERQAAHNRHAGRSVCRTEVSLHSGAAVVKHAFAGAHGS